MELPTVMIAALFGVIIGSFLNVVVLRFHTGRSLSGYSHCLSCGNRLKFFDLIPVFSFLIRKGKCAYCGAHFSPRYFFVELGTGILFGILAWYEQHIVLLVNLLIFSSILVVICVYDLMHLIIPDELVIFLIPFALVPHLWEGIVNGFHIADLVFLLAPLSSFLFFWGLWKISNGRWIGLGDAKLSVPLALFLGLGSVFSLVVFAFWIGAFISVSLLAVAWVLRRGKRHLRFLPSGLTIKSEVPFAPFLILSFIVVYCGADVLSLSLLLMGGVL